MMGIGKRLLRRASMALALVFALIVLGCGGGGSAGSLGGTNFFLSDAPASDYDQVWVRVFEVSAVAGGSSKTVFKSSEGVVLDVASLNDGAARFAFLGSGDLPAGTTSLEIEVETQVAMMASGSDEAEICTFNSAHANGNGRTKLTVPFAPAEGETEVVIDFDLSAWTVNNGVIDPVVKIGPKSGLNAFDRHEETIHIGTVSKLEGTPPAQSFVLTTPDGRMFAVVTNEATVVFDANGAMASLESGQRVSVTGHFSVTSNAFLAASVHILGANTDRHFMGGRAFDPNLSSSTFLCEVKRAHGFVPNHRIVTVSTPEHTVFLSPSGEPIDKERFYEAIDDDDKFIVAGGHYDGSVNVFTARFVKLHHRHDERHEVHAAGEIIGLAPQHHAFALRVHEWDGTDHEPDVVKVVTGSETRFFAPDGAPITEAQFYNRARPGTVVGVEGLYADHVVRARVVRVRHWGENDSPHSAHGRVTEINAAESMFGLHLREWSGFDPPGDDIRVQVTNSTVIMDRHGNSYTREQFFHELQPGAMLSVFGQFDGQMVARKIIVHTWGGPIHFSGTAVEWNAELGVIVLAVLDSPLGNGTVHVRVNTHAETQFSIGDLVVTKAQFFAALAVGLRVGVEGSFEGDDFVADKCKLLNH